MSKIKVYKSGKRWYLQVGDTHSHITEEDAKEIKKQINSKQKEKINTILDNLIDDFKTVWDLTDKDDWIQSVKMDFDKIKKIIKKC